MLTTSLRAIGLCFVVMLTSSAAAQRPEAPRDHPVTRIAEIEVEPAQIDQYRTALREGIEAAVRLEPGVLALYAVSVQGRPEQVRVFEVYASQAAYESHIQTPHFKKYKATVANMVRSLKLIDTDPIQLGSKVVALP